MKDPMRSGAEFNMFASFVQHADEMAQSYLEEFGEEIVLHGTENAGYEFLKRLMDNGLILMADSGTVVRAVGSSGKETPVLGLLGYSKLRTFAEENKPATGVCARILPSLKVRCYSMSWIYTLKIRNGSTRMQLE